MSLDILNPSQITSEEVSTSGHSIGWYKDDDRNIYVVEQAKFAPMFVMNEDSELYRRIKSVKEKPVKEKPVKEKPVLNSVSEKLFLKTIAIMKSDVKVNDIDL